MPDKNYRFWRKKGKNRDIYFISDIHLTEIEEHNEAWKEYKSGRFAPDGDLIALLDSISMKATHSVDLVIGGDFIDFRTVLHRPDGSVDSYGLPPTKKNSVWKLKWVIGYHTEFFTALAEFVKEGNRVHIISGNHDLEFNFAAVRRTFRSTLFQFAHPIDYKRLGQSTAAVDFYHRIRFYRNHVYEEGLFYAEHGHMYDPFCSLPEERTLIFDDDGSVRLLLPFGDMTSKYLSNTLGYFNPYDAQSFLLTLREYFVLLFKYNIFSSRSLPFNWIWGSFKTLIQAVRDARKLETRLFQPKDRSITLPENARRKVRKLWQHSAVFNLPLVIRTLRLDILALVGVVSVVIISPVISLWLTFGLLILGPIVVARWHSWHKKMRLPSAGMNQSLKTAAKLQDIIGVPYVVLGHTHVASLRERNGGAIVDTGTWAPIFSDKQKTQLWEHGRTYFRIQVRGKKISHEFMRYADGTVREYIPRPS